VLGRNQPIATLELGTIIAEIRDYFRLKLGKWAIFKNAG